MILHLLLGAAAVMPLSFLVLALCAKSALFGFEDATGFHFGFEPSRLKLVPVDESRESGTDTKRLETVPGALGPVDIAG